MPKMKISFGSPRSLAKAKEDRTPTMIIADANRLVTEGAEHLSDAQQDLRSLCDKLTEVVRTERLDPAVRKVMERAATVAEHLADELEDLIDLKLRDFVNNVYDLKMHTPIPHFDYRRSAPRRGV